MIDKSKILSENKKRNAELFAPYDPFLGIGSPVQRRKFVFDSRFTFYLMDEAFEDPIIKEVSKYKSVEDYVKTKLPHLNITVAKSEMFNHLDKVRRKHDFEYWAYVYHPIQDAETGEISMFKFRRPQRKVWKEILVSIRAKKPIRAIIGKARQWGGSTFANALHRWIQVEIKENWDSAICADVEDQAKNIRGMSTLMYERYPHTKLNLSPYQGSSKNKVVKERGCIVGVGSMEKPDNLRSFNFKMLHLCVHPDTQIPTKDGFIKYAHELKIGDQVITHTGAITKINNIDSGKPSVINGDGKGITIKAWLSQPITLTPNHPVWTNKGWINAGDLTKNDFLLLPIREIKHNITSIQLGEKKQRPQGGGCIPKSNNAIIELNSEIGYFFGYYLAEGSIHYRYKNGKRFPNQIALTRHDKETEYGDRAVNAVINYISSHTRLNRINCNTTLENIYDVNLSEYVANNLGVKEFKTIPDWFFDCGEDFLKGVLQGYLSGDGSKINGKQANYELSEINSRSVSSSIAMQIRDIAASLGFGWAALDIHNAGNRYGRNCKRIYTIRWNGKSARNIRKFVGFYVPDNGKDSIEKSFIKDGYIWLKIRNIEETKLEQVYDIEVEHEDHSFRTISFPVKNTEVGLWKKTQNRSPKALAQSLRSQVKKVEWSVIILESTAKGTGNFFHDEWLKAVKSQKEGKVGYIPIFVPWFEIEIYQKPIENYERFIDTINEYAWYLWELGATLEGINWYFDFKDSENMDDIQMNSEYPSTPEEMFATTGRRAFSPLYVKRARLNNMPPMFIGDIFGDAFSGKEALNNIRFEAYPKGQMKIWAFPDTSVKCKNRYVVTVDIGGKSKGADYSVIRVLDRYPLLFGGVPEAILTWKGHLDQDLVIWKATQIAKIYDNALLVPEQNSLRKDIQASEGDHFLTLLDEIIEYYDNIFCRTTPEQIKQGAPKRYGFHTGSNKADLVTNTNKKLRDDGYVEYDSEVCDEYDWYEIKDDGTFGAIEGQHDDLVMATAIGNKASDLMEMPVIITEEHKYIPSKQIVSEATF